MDITTEGASAHGGESAVDGAEVSVSADRVADLVAGEFGIFASSVASCGSETAAVFRVDVDGRPAVAVKVFRADDVSSRAARWQHEVVRRIADAGLPVARPRWSLAGELTVRTRMADAAFLVQVSDWLGGTPIEGAPVTTDLLVDVGRVAARLHERLRAERVPAGIDEHAWQITGVRATIEHALSRIGLLTREGGLSLGASERQRLDAAARRVFALLDTTVVPRLSSLPTAVVHHDLHDANLLVGPGPMPTLVTGILDFGDMTRSVRISEPVIAGAYAARHCADPAAAVGDVLRGWAESVPVTADEAEVVLPLAAARLIANATVWASRLGTARGDYAASRRRGSLDAAEKILATV